VFYRYSSSNTNSTPPRLGWIWCDVQSSPVQLNRIEDSRRIKYHKVPAACRRNHRLILTHRRLRRQQNTSKLQSVLITAQAGSRCTPGSSTFVRETSSVRTKSMSIWFKLCYALFITRKLLIWVFCCIHRKLVSDSGKLLTFCLPFLQPNTPLEIMWKLLRVRAHQWAGDHCGLLREHRFSWLVGWGVWMKLWYFV